MKGMELADRKRLPATRNSMTRRTVLFDENGRDIDLYIIFSKYEDTSTIAEVRVTVSKQGSTLQGLVDGWATMVSIALQHGVPMDSIVDKFSGVNFPPCGETSDSRIPICSSILDYIARMLALEEEY